MLIGKKYPEIFSDPAVHEHPIFAGFSPASLSEIAGYFTSESLDEGAEFSSKGNERFFIVQSGKIDAEEKIKNNPANNVFSLSRGQSDGAILIIRPDFCVTKYRVVQQSVIVALTREKFDIMIGRPGRSCNRFYFNICNIISEKLEHLNNKFVQLYAQGID